LRPSLLKRGAQRGHTAHQSLKHQREKKGKKKEGGELKKIGCGFGLLYSIYNQEEETRKKIDPNNLSSFPFFRRCLSV
jgi:hypothetical protein